MSLIYVKEVIIPTQVEFLAFRGLGRILDTVNIINSKVNKDLKVSGIIACRYDKRKNLNKEVVANIKNKFNLMLFKTYVRDNISLAEAPTLGQTIFEYNSRSYGAEDYLKLSKEIIRRH